MDRILGLVSTVRSTIRFTGLINYSTEYKLDDRGNWIQRKTLALAKDKQAVPLEVTYRTITYYQ